MPCLAARPLRGTTNAAKPSGRAIETPVPTSGPGAGGELERFGSVEVGSGITGMRVFRDGRTR